MPQCPKFKCFSTCVIFCPRYGNASDITFSAVFHHLISLCGYLFCFRMSTSLRCCLCSYYRCQVTPILIPISQHTDLHTKVKKSSFISNYNTNSSNSGCNSIPLNLFIYLFAFGFGVSQARCTWALFKGPFAPHIESWEPRNLTKVPYGPQA